MSLDKLNRLGSASEFAPRSPQSLVHLSGHLSHLPETVAKLIIALERNAAPRPVRVRVRAMEIKQPNHKLHPDEIDALVKAYVPGMSMSELGRRFGIHRSTAKAHVERRGIEVEPW